MQRELKRVKNGKYFLIPASREAARHGTTGNAKWWKGQFVEWMKGCRSSSRRTRPVQVSPREVQVHRSSDFSAGRSRSCKSSAKGWVWRYANETAR